MLFLLGDRIFFNLKIVLGLKLFKVGKCYTSKYYEIWNRFFKMKIKF